MEQLVLHPAQARVLRLRKRPWWVCVYGHRPTRVRKYAASFVWALHPNPWVGALRKWELLDIKSFPNVMAALASSAYLRGYDPFSNPEAMVVLLKRTHLSLAWLTEYRLYNEEDEPS